MLKNDVTITEHSVRDVADQQEEAQAADDKDE